MSTTVIGFKGALPQQPFLDLSQNGGQQYIQRQRAATPINLQPGQTFIIPNGSFEIVAGRYTAIQWFDVAVNRWRNYATQPGQSKLISSDGQNYRIANTTGTPVSAAITNVGAGNAANGYNTVTVTPSAGNSTWGTLVGGTLNTTVVVNNGGNYSLAPLIVWQAAGNQTIPFVPPEFTANINANGTINTVTVVDIGAGLTAPGTITAIQQPGDTNPGNANITLAANLTNSGNLTAMWPLTPGTNVTAVPTLTFNIGGGMAATAIMNFTVTGVNGTANAGANFGANQQFTLISGNGIANVSANALVSVSVNDFEVDSPRMAWLSGNSNAAGNASNGNITVVDGGLNLQAVPFMIALPGNASGLQASSAVFTAVVGGVTDVTYLQLV